MNRYLDWLEQGRANLRHARNSLEMGDYSWACFAAHQAAEAALKGLHLKYGQVAWGHSILDLLAELPGDAKAQHLRDEGALLDKFYIPTRYPDAHPAGPASRHYTKTEARQAIFSAEKVVVFCEDKGVEAQ